MFILVRLRKERELNYVPSMTAMPLALHAAIYKKTRVFLSVFPVFVPSLSRQNERF